MNIFQSRWLHILFAKFDLHICLSKVSRNVAAFDREDWKLNLKISQVNRRLVFSCLEHTQTKHWLSAKDVVMGRGKGGG